MTSPCRPFWRFMSLPALLLPVLLLPALLLCAPVFSGALALASELELQNRPAQPPATVTPSTPNVIIRQEDGTVRRETIVVPAPREGQETVVVPGQSETSSEVVKDEVKTTVKDEVKTTVKDKEENTVILKDAEVQVQRDKEKEDQLKREETTLAVPIPEKKEETSVLKEEVKKSETQVETTRIEEKKVIEEKAVPLNPGSFLVKTAAPEEKPEAQPEKKKEAKATAEKAKEEKPTPPKKAEVKKSAENQKPAKGQGLQIPDSAKDTGDMSFLEGCWVGTRPEYYTKRMVKERFCFDANGVGKRFITDPSVAGECVGATRALVNKDGVLRMDSEKMYCTNITRQWGASEMTCQGEGNQTPCTWEFKDANGSKQSYKIRFVRE